MLEEYYVAVGRIRNAQSYERRSKQYDHMDVRRDRIIALAAQVKCFVGMFLNEPHSTHRYYGELLNSYRGRLFGESHAPVTYYVAGVSLSTVEHLFAEGVVARDLRPYRYQVPALSRCTSQELARLRLRPTSM